MKIAIGSDLSDLSFKKQIIDIITAMGHSYDDFSSKADESKDYPDIARAVSEAITKSQSDYGILISETGIGMSMAANKIPGIRAALCYDALSAQMTRRHNNANVICVREKEKPVIQDILKEFFNTQFEGGRHQRRLDKISDIESRLC